MRAHNGFYYIRDYGKPNQTKTQYTLNTHTSCHSTITYEYEYQPHERNLFRRLSRIYGSFSSDRTPPRSIWNRMFIICRLMYRTKTWKHTSILLLFFFFFSLSSSLCLFFSQKIWYRFSYSGFWFVTKHSNSNANHDSLTTTQQRNHKLWNIYSLCFHANKKTSWQKRYRQKKMEKKNISFPTWTRNKTLSLSLSSLSYTHSPNIINFEKINWNHRRAMKLAVWRTPLITFIFGKVGKKKLRFKKIDWKIDRLIRNY